MTSHFGTPQCPCLTSRDDPTADRTRSTGKSGLLAAGFSTCLASALFGSLASTTALGVLASGPALFVLGLMVSLLPALDIGHSLGTRNQTAVAVNYAIGWGGSLSLVFSLFIPGVFISGLIASVAAGVIFRLIEPSLR